MLDADQKKIVKLIVSAKNASGKYDVCEQGFEVPIAEFDDMETAEKYALQIADTKSNWIVETYDDSGTLVGTYNSDDDSMPKPELD
jgi:hypothetical protein